MEIIERREVFRATDRSETRIVYSITGIWRDYTYTMMIEENEAKVVNSVEKDMMTWSARKKS